MSILLHRARATPLYLSFIFIIYIFIGYIEQIFLELALKSKKGLTIDIIQLQFKTTLL